jgi:hypothetical protein
MPMTLTWSQDYDPLHAWPLSTFVSALPVLTLLTLLVVRRARVCLVGLIVMLYAFAIPGAIPPPTWPSP